MYVHQLVILIKQFDDMRVAAKGMIKYQISLKSIQWESSCYMRTDKETNMAKLIVAIRTFAKVHRNCVENTVESYRTSPLNMYCYVIYLPFSMNLCIMEGQ